MNSPTPNAGEPDDIRAIYTVSWEVHDGRRWKPASLVPMTDKPTVEELAEQIRTNPRARTRKVTITEQRVREVKTAFLPYWVPAGDAA